MCKKPTLAVVAVLGALTVALLLLVGSESPRKAWADPPADQSKDAKDKTYVGRAKCASCHLKENTSWKKMKHAAGVRRSFGKLQGR